MVLEKFKNTPDYEENMRAITKSISQVYELDYYMLEELFSKSIQEIKQYNEVSEGLLAGVA